MKNRCYEENVEENNYNSEENDESEDIESLKNIFHYYLLCIFSDIFHLLYPNLHYLSLTLIVMHW